MDELTAKDEAQILQNGVQTEFWQLIVANWTRFHNIAMKELLSPNFQNKDYISGKVKAIEDLLNFPEARVKRLSAKKT